MLKRLKDLQSEFLVGNSRPFAHLSQNGTNPGSNTSLTSSNKRKREPSTPSGTSDMEHVKSKRSRSSQSLHSSPIPATPPNAAKIVNNEVFLEPSPLSLEVKTLLPPNRSHSSTNTNRNKQAKTDDSFLDLDEGSTSSSWAELEPCIIGKWQVHPLTLASKQIFTLRYLAPLGEYQEVY